MQQSTVSICYSQEPQKYRKILGSKREIRWKKFVKTHRQTRISSKQGYLEETPHSKYN